MVCLEKKTVKRLTRMSVCPVHLTFSRRLMSYPLSAWCWEDRPGHEKKDDICDPCIELWLPTEGTHSDRGPPPPLNVDFNFVYSQQHNR